MSNNQIKKLVTWAKNLPSDYQFKNIKEAHEYQLYLDLKWSGLVYE
ncbi:MAG: hypothetical protein LLF98_02505 [Clostridium sp.]|nr:hypothetical protein [Clostridium sp.]MCE5220154.1 hypothetical protein [Clostridium sp.]